MVYKEKLHLKKIKSKDTVQFQGDIYGAQIHIF